MQTLSKEKHLLDSIMKFVTGGWYRDVLSPKGVDVYTLIHRANSKYLLISELVYMIDLGYQHSSNQKIIDNNQISLWISNRAPEKVKDNEILGIIKKDHTLKL